jgi:hypothetical protein
MNIDINKKITGYRIVSEVLDVPVSPNPELAKHGLFYKGFEREIVEEFIDDSLNERLPKELSEIWAEMNEHDFEPPGWELTKKFDDALKILRYCRNKNKTIKSEMITVYYEGWETEETIECYQKCESLGYDITLREGYCSIILEGIFFKPEYFQEYIPLLNKNGLFVDKMPCQEYTELFRSLARKDIVEPADCESERQIVEVCRIAESEISG